MGSTSAKCLQLTLVFLSVFYVVLGVLLVYYGSGLVVNGGNGRDSDAYRASVAFLAIGSLTALVGLVGVISACCRSKLLLSVYVVLLILTLIAQVIVGSLSISYSSNNDKIDSYSQTWWNSLQQDGQVRF